MEEKIPIYTIVVHPRNQFYAQYVVNESNPHTKTYEDLGQYLISLIPEKVQVINDLLDRKRHFVCLIQEKEVKELHFDLEKEFEEYKKNVKNDFFKEAHNFTNSEKKNTFDSNIKGISNLKLW